jgi:hypothetical protein
MYVRAVDPAGNASGQRSRSFTVDTTPPTVVVDSGPSGTTSDTTPTFTFSSEEEGMTFECRVDLDDFESCDSPYTPPRELAEGSHTFSVRARDEAGNVSEAATRSFDVVLPKPPPPPADGGTVTQAGPIARPASSFVLIAARTVRVSRSRRAPVTLNCSGSKECAGTLRLDTANKVRTARRRSGRRRIVRLGSVQFKLAPRATRRVLVRLSKRNYRIVKRLRRVKVMVIIQDKDNAGRARTSTRVITLRVR